MAGFAEQKAELDALGIKVAAASVDPIDKANEVADEVNFPVGYGATKALGDKLGGWWEERRQIIQPIELMVNSENQVVGSSYADGPLGRMQVADVISLIKVFDARAKQ